MIKGIEAHLWDAPFNIDKWVVGGQQAFFTHYLRPGLTTLDLSGPTPVTKTFTWNQTDGHERVHNFAALPGGRWMVQTYRGSGSNVTNRWRRTLSFDALPEGGGEPRADCAHFYHDLTCVSGRLLTTRHGEGRETVVEITDTGEHLLNLWRADSSVYSFETARFGDGTEALFWCGDVHHFEGDDLTPRLALRYTGRISFGRVHHPLTGQTAPWGQDGLYHLISKQYTTSKGGKLMRSRPGEKAVCVLDNPAIDGVMGLPDGGLFVTTKTTRTSFGRIIFPEAGFFTNLTQKALGTDGVFFSAAWYDKAREALCLAHERGLLIVPWQGILGNRRLKLKPPSPHS